MDCYLRLSNRSTVTELLILQSIFKPRSADWANSLPITPDCFPGRHPPHPSSLSHLPRPHPSFTWLAFSQINVTLFYFSTLPGYSLRFWKVPSTAATLPARWLTASRVPASPASQMHLHQPWPLQWCHPSPPSMTRGPVRAPGCLCVPPVTQLAPVLKFTVSVRWAPGRQGPCRFPLSPVLRVKSGQDTGCRQNKRMETLASWKEREYGLNREVLQKHCYVCFFGTPASRKQLTKSRMDPLGPDRTFSGCRQEPATSTPLTLRKTQGCSSSVHGVNWENTQVTSLVLFRDLLTDFIFLGSKVTVDSDCSHEIKRRLLFGGKAITNPDSLLKSRDITLLSKVCLVKPMVFPVVMYGRESWAIKKAERWRTDAFELWCWRRLESSLDCKEIQPVHP